MPLIQDDISEASPSFHKTATAYKNCKFWDWVKEILGQTYRVTYSTIINGPVTGAVVTHSIVQRKLKSCHMIKKVNCSQIVWHKHHINKCITDSEHTKHTI